MRVIISLLIVLLLTACGGSSETEAPAEPAKPQKRFMEEQFKAMDKAKGVEKTLQEGAEAQRKVIEEQGG